MITEIDILLRLQQTSSKENWLFHDEADGNRTYCRKAYLGKEAEPWAECTNEEKEAWEETHKPEEPDEQPE